METRNFKITQSPHGILLFPVPVDKTRLFLMRAQSMREAEILKYLLDPGYLSDPLTKPEMYQQISTHTDGVTPIFELEWEKLVLEFLPKRGVDLDRAMIIENLLSRKISRLRGAERPVAVIDDIIHRFQKQKECSECDKLGINDEALERWFQGLTRLK